MVARPSSNAAIAVHEAARRFSHPISFTNATSGPVSTVCPPSPNSVGGLIMVVCYHRPEGKLKQCDSLITLREILDAAVERIRQPNLPRIWRDNQLIPIRGVQVDGAGQGETVEYERQASSGDRVRLVEKTEV